jgi:Family of unknown function (DUF6448)
VPPHCDPLDGPVVTAAREALERGDVHQVLPYVSEQGEPELRRVFDLAVKARSLGPAAAVVADRWLFETAVRLHRAGEGAAFTGLKPAGLDVGPVIPAAERALESGSADRLAEVLCGVVRDRVARRHAHAMEAKERAGEGLSASREYVKAALGLQVWAHGVYRQATSDPHPGAASEGGDGGR